MRCIPKQYRKKFQSGPRKPMTEPTFDTVATSHRSSRRPTHASFGRHRRRGTLCGRHRRHTNPHAPRSHSPTPFSRLWRVRWPATKGIFTSSPIPRNTLLHCDKEFSNLTPHQLITTTKWHHPFVQPRPLTDLPRRRRTRQQSVEQPDVVSREC
jgi:hypothetical protein